ncbi:MAG: tRNA epoxyqueuosine(34) reductase QueG [Lewinellaceae bacterium]|nr:tRNA epoxyqueuosine(34) reductase QueG [Saprospiraceae bacterium]MCB9340920.1 tRNA epoxyqueuosine(34) reductase QueG [Lewinellaceae bacterium]
MKVNANYVHLIRQEALRLGFSHLGIARAAPLDAEARRLEAWLNKGYHGKMQYMENHFDLRTDPTRLVPGAKSVIVLMHNYCPSETQHDPEAPKLARYAYGEDYHQVLRKKLKALLRFIRENIGEVDGRCFVDSAPVMERDWAQKTGIGWAGKNTLLINPKAGSYYFLAELILDLELPADDPIKDYCGTCRRCIEACPTGAISPEGYLLDASRCISYLTIELREAIPLEFRGNMENWMFGCDICQEVCPWNRFSEPHEEPAFAPREGLLKMTKQQWEEITEEVFQQYFEKSAVKRAKFKGLKRNIGFLGSKEK